MAIFGLVFMRWGNFIFWWLEEVHACTYWNLFSCCTRFLAFIKVYDL